MSEILKDMISLGLCDDDDEFETMQQECMTEEERRFTILDDQTADWAARKIAEAEADTEKWEKHYEEMLTRIRRKNDFRITYMKYLLRKYFFTVPHKMSKTQSSYQLPSGRLIMKAQGPEFQRDEEQLLPWVKQNAPGMVKVKETVDWAGLKKQLEGRDGIAVSDGQVVSPDGEVVPGIMVVERPNVFKVEVKE